MKTKRQQAIEMFNDDPKKALMFCKKWPNLGKDRDVILRGADCTWNPNFYISIGFDPEICVDLAIQCIKKMLGV